ncbi:uncharacterized protein N7458_000208 [Penicillium daleae]|uniref:Uncharacterized protein n=1 Tax=Penicillium daleae TaxID=63821 RepID=A0AAD6CFV1_9EURO|nr:uncharacterized protein N7458_000208 [Penicillium daleae]KAJ5464522.1 hypothetical protein N7458_000208 [Penicillium daleae]
MQALEDFMEFTDEEKRLTKLIGYVRAANARWTFGEVAPFDYDAFMSASQEVSEPKELVQVHKSTYYSGRYH